MIGAVETPSPANYEVNVDRATGSWKIEVPIPRCKGCEKGLRGELRSTVIMAILSAIVGAFFADKLHVPPLLLAAAGGAAGTVLACFLALPRTMRVNSLHNNTEIMRLLAVGWTIADDPNRLQALRELHRPPQPAAVPIPSQVFPPR